MTDERARIFRFLELGDRAGTRVEPWRFGTAVFNDELPLRWDSNYLRVERLPDRVTVDELVAEADRVQGGRGLAHRKLSFPDDALAARVEPELRNRGWTTQKLLVMVHRRPPERSADLALVQEVDEADLRPLREKRIREQPWGRDPEVARQLLDARSFLARTLRTRFFAVKADGDVVSYADLYSREGTAQIEDVATAEEHRGRGYATAVVLRALEEAKDEGNDLVFLLADDDDWPKALYARLGFDGIARTYDFVRPGPA